MDSMCDRCQERGEKTTWRQRFRRYARSTKSAYRGHGDYRFHDGSDVMERLRDLPSKTRP